MNKYIIPSEVYEVMKWAGLIAFPAAAVFVSTVGQAWGMDASLSNAIVTTLNAIGVLIGASSASRRRRRSRKKVTGNDDEWHRRL